MDPYLLLALVLVLYTLGAAGPSLLGQERLAWRSAIEILLWGMALLAVFLVLRASSPFLYLIVLYPVTMRTRLLVDLANLLAVRRYPMAQHVYGLAQRVALSPLDRASAAVNRGAALLYAGQVVAAISVLEEALAGGRLGRKLGAACRCNLGLAHLRGGNPERGRALLREAAELLPSSIYARRARLALQRPEAPPAQTP